MTKNVSSLIFGALLACGVMLAGAPVAHAVDAFKKEFDAKYVKKDSAEPNEKSLAEAVAAAKCNVCHAGKSKKERNEYGKALATLLKKGDAKDTAKIQDALEKVAAMKSSSADASAPTFGELISQGKLPGGTP